jgi:hypothetical protein
VPTGEALGEGGRGAHRWQGDARQNRKRHSSAGEVWNGGCSDARSDGRWRVGRAARGRSVGMEEAGA